MMMMMSLLSVFFVILCVFLSSSSAAFDSVSKRLSEPPPNADSQCFDSYAGYLKVHGGEKYLFHWYHEAVSGPEKAPITLWLNGGPGCSSLGGMFTELGPYVLDKNLKITLNPYSWNKVSNVLFLEQPAGVGFSYPGGKTNDTITAADTYEGLIEFFKLHPELENRPFYVAGESYGGHYVPNIVRAIQDGNTRADKTGAPKINIKGFAVGNGYTDWKLDFNANVENGRFHALTSQDLYDAAYKACDEGNFARCFWPRDDVECPKTCNDAVALATEQAMDGSIDIYDIYVDVCLDPETGAKVDTQMSLLMDERKKQVRRNRRRLDNKGSLGVTPISPVFDTCVDKFAATYLNTPEVRTYLGIRDDTLGNWSDCGGVEYDFNYASEIPNYEKWVAGDGDLEILIYNGDADYILSHMGNSAWVRSLGLPKSREWSKWRGSDGQVAGYFEQYKTSGSVPMTFLTVKGAGHMVPKDRPRHALDMFSQFLAGGAAYEKVSRSSTEPLCPHRTEL